MSEFRREGEVTKIRTLLNKGNYIKLGQGGGLGRGSKTSKKIGDHIWIFPSGNRAVIK